MKTAMTWLLAGAALTLCAGVTVAIAADPSEPAATIRQAQEDARAAEADAQAAQADARAAREDALQAREEARREVRIYRDDDDDDDDLVVSRGGGREESLSRLLRLRPEQESALAIFLEATRPDHHGRDHMVRFDRDGDSRTTLQRLDEMQARAAERRAEMDRKVAAIKSFYALLDAPQKQTFDAMPMLMMIGPNIGPMIIPRPLPIVHRTPPIPPVPPVPPALPRS